MITLTIIICGGFVLAGVVVLLRAILGAPQGYETAQGFFEGVEPPLPATVETSQARFGGMPDGLVRRFADRLGSGNHAESWPWGGQAADEPVLSTRAVSPHVHSVQ